MPRVPKPRDYEPLLRRAGARVHLHVREEGREEPLPVQLVQRVPRDAQVVDGGEGLDLGGPLERGPHGAIERDPLKEGGGEGRRGEVNQIL